LREPPKTCALRDANSALSRATAHHLRVRRLRGRVAGVLKAGGIVTRRRGGAPLRKARRSLHDRLEQMLAVFGFSDYDD
jgi:hypothetical protein